MNQNNEIRLHLPDEAARARIIEQGKSANEIGITYSAPPISGDETTRAAQASDWQNQRDLTIFRFSVAPGCTVTGARGRRIEGEEIDVQADLLGSYGVVRELVTRRIVIEISEPEVDARTMAKSSRYVVAERPLGSGPRSILTHRRGVLIPGQAIEVDDCSEEEIPEFRDDLGRMHRGRPAHDGRKSFADLLAHGLVLDRGPSFGPAFDEEPTAKKGKAA